jgi:hypothetical protein
MYDMPTKWIASGLLTTWWAMAGVEGATSLSPIGRE